MITPSPSMNIAKQPTQTDILTFLLTMTNATRLTQLRLFYTAQLNSLVQRKETILKSTTSLRLYESTAIPSMLFSDPRLVLVRHGLRYWLAG